MMEEAQFLVQWDEHPTHLATRLGYLLEHQSLVDVTLMCNTHTLKVHRAVLAACSPYFERQLGNHPLIVLKDMKFSVLKSLVEFMYCGETSVSEDNLTPLLEAAKFFEVKGLAAMTKESVRHSNNSTIKINGTTSHLGQVHNSFYGVRGVGGRGRGRGRGRPPLSSKVASPTESAQILLSLSGNQPSPQLLTTSKNVKIDPAVLGDAKGKFVDGVAPRRRGRRRSAFNAAIRERLLRDSSETISDDNSPLLSSLLSKPELKQRTEDNKYLQTLKDIGLPTNVPILYDNGEGKLVKLTEDVLKNVISNDGNLQFHVADNSLPDCSSVAASSSSSSSTTSSNTFNSLLVPNKKGNNNTICEKVFDKENKHFVVKEMHAFHSERDLNLKIPTRETLSKLVVKSECDNPPSDQLNDTDLESLKSGVATEAESDPEAVVLFEVTDNKKVQKCVLSANDINTLKVLNEQLSKQKKQLADMTKNNVSTIDVTGNAKVAELKLKISKTTSVLAQIIERVQGFKGFKELSAKVLNEESPESKRAQSQVVQLEFIDGNGEKIEGYQVEGTVVDKRLPLVKKEGSESKVNNDLIGLLDMVCDNGNDQAALIGANSYNIKKCDEEDQDLGIDEPSDVGLMEATEPKDMNYHLVMNNHLSEQTISYDNIDDMMNESNSNIAMESKNQDLKYIIDNEGNIINQEDNYVVYHNVKEEMASSEYVIYDGSESVLPDMGSHGGTESFDVCEDSQVLQNQHGTEFIVYGENKSNVDEIKEIVENSNNAQYIIYSDENPEKSHDAFDENIDSEMKSDKNDDFNMFTTGKDSEVAHNSADVLLDQKPSVKCVPSSVGLMTLKDSLSKYEPYCTEDQGKSCSDVSNSSSNECLENKRRCSVSTDLSDKLSCKKRKIDSLEEKRIDSS